MRDAHATSAISGGQPHRPVQPVRNSSLPSTPLAVVYIVHLKVGKKEPQGSTTANRFRPVIFVRFFAPNCFMRVSFPLRLARVSHWEALRLPPETGLLIPSRTSRGPPQQLRNIPPWRVMWASSDKPPVSWHERWTTLTKGCTARVEYRSSGKRAEIPAGGIVSEEQYAFHRLVIGSSSWFDTQCGILLSTEK